MSGDSNELFLKVLFVLIIVVLIAILFVNYIIIALVIGIPAVIVFIVRKIKINKNKIEFRKIVNKNFENFIIKPEKIVDIKQLKEKLGLFNLNIYNDLFEEKIIKRGQGYYANNTVQHF